MTVRLVQPGDRAEWLRLLLGLYPGSAEGDHAPDVDLFLSGRPAGLPHHAAIFVHERPTGGLGGLLELSIRNYAEGCSGPTPYVESWYVDEDLRGQGIGRLLLEAAEGWARAQGYREIASDTELDNQLSYRVHLAAGFEEVERAIHFRKGL